jgi:hypothetical protein
LTRPERNTKHQAQSSKEVSKPKTPNLKARRRDKRREAQLLSLVLLWSLELGARELFGLSFSIVDMLPPLAQQLPDAHYSGKVLGGDPD